MNALTLVFLLMVTFQWDHSPSAHIDGVVTSKIYSICEEQVTYLDEVAYPATEIEVEMSKRTLATCGFFVKYMDDRGMHSDRSNICHCDAKCRKKYLAPKKIIGVQMENH